MTLSPTSSRSGAASAVTDPITEQFGAAATAFEFATSSMTGLTTLGTPGTLNADTAVQEHLYVAKNGTGFSLHGCYAASPAMPFTAITCLKTPLTLSNALAGLFVGAAAPGAAAICAVHAVASVRGLSWLVWTDVTAGPSSSAQIFTAQGWSPTYLAIVANSNTDLDLYASLDGYNWTAVLLNLNPALTVGSVGLAVDAANSVLNAAAFEYLRLFSSALTFPGV